MNISVIGTGYVGLITGLGFAKLGHNIYCVDIDKNKVDLINSGKTPIYEDGAEELLKQVLNKNFRATTNLKEALDKTSITFISVGTPSLDNGGIDLRYIKQAAESIGKILANKKEPHVVVIKSTVLPGTAEQVVRPLIPASVGIVSNPEFLKEGYALKDFLEPDRIIIGTRDEKSMKIMEQLYSGFRAPILKTDNKTAEMIKYASNAFLATKISFINEIGNFCKMLGIDTYEVAKGIGLDKRINPYFLNSGIGFGGSCFPKDVKALISKAEEMGYEPSLLKDVINLNEKQPLKLLEIAKNRIKNKRIGVLGLAFKEGTDDIRESPALILVKELVKTNHVTVYDPQAMENTKHVIPESEKVRYAKNAQEVIDASDVIFILTEWKEFRALDYRNKYVFEGKHIFDKDNKPKNTEGVCW